MGRNVIKAKSYAFAVRVVRLTLELKNRRVENPTGNSEKNKNKQMNPYNPYF